MRGSRPKAAKRGASTGVPGRIGALLAPPDGLLDRVRWVFLLFSLLMAAVVFGLVLRSGVTPLALRLAALLAILGLVWWWIRGYSRGGFPILGIGFEGMAIFVAALAIGAPPTALGLIYSSLMFRSLFGPLRNVVALLLAYLAAFYGAAALALSFTFLDLPLATILPEPLGLPLVAVTLHALATTITRQERTVSREQTLRETGADLVKALDREEIYGAVLAGAMRLARDVPGTRASLAVGAPESMTVVASAGEGAEAVEGRSFDLRDLPKEIRDPVLGKASAWMNDADPRTMREALGFEPKVASVVYVPLLVGDDVTGLLVVASDGTLPEDIRGSLDTLGSQATLALENAAKAEDLYQRKNERRLQALVQNASDLITVVDSGGKIIYESPSVKRLFGYEPEEIVGTGMTDMVHPEDAEKVWNVFAEIASRPGVSPRVEVRARHRDGSWRHIEAVANNFLHDPNLRGIVVNSRDVTERRRAEEASRESEAGLIAAQRIAHLGNWDTGPLGGGGFDPQREIRWSDELYRILGHDPGSLVPTLGALMESVHPDDFERVREEMRLSKLARARQMETEHRILRPDGETRTVRARVETVYAEHGEPVSSHGILLDVTESKKVEDALRRSESELAAAQRLAHVGNWVFEVDRDEARWSDEMYRIFGFEPGAFTVTYKSFFKLVHADDREKVRRAVRKALFDEEPMQDLDYRVRRTDGEVRHLRAQYEIERGPAGRAERLIGTAHDVTEQVRFEEALRESEARYRALVEQTPAITYIEALDEGETDHDILYVSPQIEELLGYSQEEWMTDPGLFSKLVHPEDKERVLAEDARTERTGEPFSVEYRNFARDGRLVWLRDEAVLVRDESGRPLYWQGVMYDTTEAKRTEEELGRLAAIVESSDDAVYSTDLDGAISTWNRGAEALYGYSAEEIVGRPVTLLSPPDRRWEVPMALERVRRGEGVDRRESARVSKDGQRIDVSITISPIRDARGAVVGASAIARDVTERKEAEQELRRSEERFRSVVEQAADALFIHDPDGNLVDVNRRACESLGYTREELVGMSVVDVEESFDLGELERLWEAMEAGRHVTLDGIHRRKDGSTFPVEIRIGLFQSGDSRLVLGAARDVTERRRADEELRRSEQNLATAQRIASVGSWEFDVVGEEERWSDETYRILGLEPQSFVPSAERFLDHVHPEDKRAFEEYAFDLSDGSAPEGLEHRIVRPDGEVRVVHNRREVERDASGAPLRAAGTVQDVTERRQAEQRLRDAERRYRTLVEQLPAVTYIQDAFSNDLSYASPQLEAVLGYRPEEYLADPSLFAETIHPDDREWVLAEDRRTDITGEPYSLECRRVTRDGRVVWVQDEARLVKDAEGRPLFWQGLLTDITERKRAEEALRQSEGRYRAVVEQAVEGIYLVDPDTKAILESNPAFRRLLGRTAEELSGMTLYDVVAHEEDSVDAAVGRVTEKGYHAIGERRHRRKDGSLVEVEVSASVISYKGRDVLSCVAHDITERKEAERALRESMEMFRAVFEDAALGVALSGRDGKFTQVNAALARFLGYGAQELRGKSFVELTHPDDMEPTVGSLRRLLAGDVERYSLEKRYRRGDGNFVWAHVTVSGIRNADGEVRYVLGLIEDITERKRAEEEIRQLNEDLERRVAERTSELEATITDLERAQSALRRGEARTRAIVETAPDAIVTMTGDGLVRSFNSGAERIFGYGAAEILGRPLATLMPERFRAMHERGLRRHLATGESKMIGQGSVELAGLRKEGTEFPLELSLGELREEGEVLYTGIVRDITERKEAEEKVRRAEERYRNLVERMPAVTYLQEIGSPDSAVYMSPQIEALTGYTPEDCQDPELRWRMVHPEDRERMRSEEESTGEPGDVFTHEYRVLHRDGRTVWVRNESVLIEDAASGSRYWHGFMVDITERKRAEASQRAYAEKLQRSNRELQDFAHVASHDLQEPLRKVSSFGERLRTRYADALGGQGLDYLRRMEGATVRMQGLIEDLLSLSRVTTQANPFEPVDLNGVAEEVLSDLEARLEETGGTVEVGDLPTVEADRLQMRQLLQNLVGNALKFHKDGQPPDVRVYVEPEPPAATNGGRPRYRLVVEDDGIGFDEEHLSRIFVPFERLHGRGAYEGTGMGLAICRKVVERHGGEITAESAPGHGARFITTLPTKQIDEVPAGREED